MKKEKIKEILTSRIRSRFLIMILMVMIAVALCPENSLHDQEEKNLSWTMEMEDIEERSTISNILSKIASDISDTFVPIEAQAATVVPDDAIKRGTSGTCTWYIGADGELVIGPTNGDEGTLDNCSKKYEEVPWYSYRASIKSIRFEGTVHGNNDCRYMFNGLYNLVDFNGTGFDTKNVKIMDQMFRGCNIITSFDLSNFDTRNATSMKYMFADCDKLETLNLSTFNIENVTDMSNMFYYCTNLKTLNLSSFHPINVKTMQEMFFGCSTLSSINLPNFNTKNVTNLKCMFSGCESLESLDLSNFNTENVTDMSNMFSGCKSLTNLDLSNFNTENVVNIGAMFYLCENLISLDLSNFNTKNATSMGGMFSYCGKLTNLDISNFNTEKVTNMAYMFRECSKLKSLDLSNFDTKNVTNMKYMFQYCYNLSDLNISSFNTENVTDMEEMFVCCESLINLDLSSFNTINVTNMGHMFSSCHKLINLDLSSFDTSNVTDMGYMFNGCSSLTSLDLANFDTSNVTSMSGMFSDCVKLSKVKLGKKFNFKGKDITTISYQALLPTPTPTGTGDDEFTGNWTKGTPYNHTEAVSAETLRDTFDGATMTGTWYWEKNGSKYEENESEYEENELDISDDYKTDFVNFMQNRGTIGSIKYLCDDSLFTNSIFVHENDATFGSNVTMFLSDAIYRGIDGWKDLFNASTTTEEAEKILATLLEEYQSDAEELSMEKTAQKYAKVFTDSLDDYVMAHAIANSVDDKDIKALSDALSEEQVCKMFEKGEYNKIASYFQNTSGYSSDSGIVKTLKEYMTSKEYADSLSKSISFLGDGLEILSLTEDTVNYLYQFDALINADEMYSEILLYLADNCAYDVVCDAARNLYKVIHGSYTDQIFYVTTAIKNQVESEAFDAVLDGAAKAVPCAEIIKAGFDWGVNLSNALFHIDDTQKLKDNMRTIAYIGNTLSVWVSDNQVNFMTTSNNDAKKNEYAKKAYYGLYMLWNTRKAGEETLRQMFVMSNMRWSKYYTMSLEITATLESLSGCIFSDDMIKTLVSLTVACPVNVEVYDNTGNFILSLENGKEMEGKQGDIYYYQYYHKLENDFVKIFCFPENSNYTFKYVGTELGTVDSVFKKITDDGKTVTSIFENVPVTKDSIIEVNTGDTSHYSVTDPVSEKTDLYQFRESSDEYVAVESVSLSEKELELKIGEQKMLSASCVPQNATNQKLLWTSSDEKIVSVNSDGVITARSSGTANITVKNEEGELSSICKVMVCEPDDITDNKQEKNDVNDKKVSLTPSQNMPSKKIISLVITGFSNRIAAGKKTKLFVNGYPSGTSLPKVIWTSSNPKVATVTQAGIVTIKKNTGGKSVTVTATAADGSGIFASWKIKSMKGVVKKIAITGAKTVKAGKSLKLKAKVTATKGANKKLKWTSSNTKYATVSSSGKVKTFKAGKGKKVKITAMATDGSNKKKTVIIKIK